MHTIAPAPTDPTTAATTLIEQMESAWNRADGAAFAEPFADDADFVDIRGAHHHGRVAIGHGHQAIFDSIYAGSTVRYELDAVRVVAPGVLVGVASATLDAPTGPLAGINRSRFTVTLVEQEGRWVVTAFHNTLVPAPG